MKISIKKISLVFITHISVISTFFLFYYVEKFEREYQISISIDKWHLLAVFFVQFMTLTILGISSIAFFYTIGITSVLIKFQERVKTLRFMFFKYKSKDSLHYLSYRIIAKKRINSKLHKYTQEIFAPVFIIFLLILPLILFTLTNEEVKKIFPLFGASFNLIIYSTFISSFLILLFLETSNDKHITRAILKNKMIKNKIAVLKIIEVARNPIIFLSSYSYILLLTEIFRSNGLDTLEFFGLIVMSIGILYIILSTNKLITSLISLSSILLLVLFSQLSYIFFKSSLNGNVYISHNNNYILINKQCYENNKSLLDINNLATQYESSSYYYIKHFSKLIHNSRIIVDERFNNSQGKNDIYFIDLLNCDHVTVQNCISNFSKNKCEN